MKIEESLDSNYFNLIDDFEFIQSVYDFFQQIGPKTKNQDQIIKTGYAQNLFKGVTKVGLNYLDGAFSLPIRLKIYKQNEDISLKIKKNFYYQKLIEFDKTMRIESYEIYCEIKKRHVYCYPKIRMEPKTKSQTQALTGYCTPGFRGVAKVGLKYLFNTYQMPANIEGDLISYQDLRKKLTYKEIYEKYFKIQLVPFEGIRASQKLRKNLRKKLIYKENLCFLLGTRNIMYKDNLRFTLGTENYEKYFNKI